MDHPVVEEPTPIDSPALQHVVHYIHTFQHKELLNCLPLNCYRYETIDIDFNDSVIAI